ncbi:MAG: SDR family oxidoreductase [bacterium]
MTSQHCIVTGGAGFIGSHLVEQLLEQGHTVHALDNFSTGDQSNLSPVQGDEDFHLFERDVSNRESIEPLFEGADWVFHLAGLADIVPSIERPEDYHEANVTGTVNVLEASRKHDVDRFVYAASSSCYGIPDEYPTPETADIRPEYPYALTKYLGEENVMHWEKVYDLPAVSLRLFNVFGPRQQTEGAYGAVFGVFLAQKLADEPLTVVGDGTQTRDFTYVTDVANAFVTAAESDVTGEIFNVGSGGTYSINRLVELLDAEKTHIPERPGEPDCTFADISKIRDQLGWEPQIEFKEGVEKLLNQIDEYKDAPVWDEDSIEDATESWFEHLGDQAEAEVS